MKFPNKKIKVKKTVELEVVDSETGEFLTVKIRTICWVKFKTNLKQTAISIKATKASIKITSILILDSRGKKYKGNQRDEITAIMHKALAIAQENHNKAL